MVVRTGIVPRHVRLIEVGMRDGLQFEPRHLPTATKVAFINRLQDAGLRWIEVGSYVSSRFVPAMADTPAVVAALKPFRRDVVYTVLASTVEYVQRAIEAGLQSVAVFVGVTDRFNRANLKATTSEALARAKAVVRYATLHGVTVRGYASVCWGGPKDPAPPCPQVADVADALLQMGCTEISLGDTTASATPDTVAPLLTYLAARCDLRRFAVHFHDATGQALANIDRALDFGVTTIDTAIGGLGGCLAAGALTGNVATEHVVAHLQTRGIGTGVDPTTIRVIARDIRAALQAVALQAGDSA